MARRKKYEEDSAEMDMTPMIDIVFNLLIFFMVITDLTSKDLANLILPIAHKAAQDTDDDPDDRLILNIDKDGQLLFRNVPRSLDEVATILSETRRTYNLRQRAKGKTGEVSVGPGGEKASALFVLLRADRDTPWQHVQWLMTIMAEEKLFRLQFATKKFADGYYDEKMAKSLGAVTQKEYARTHGGEEE